MRGPIKVGDTGKFGKYGENDNFATFANKAKHKAMRGPIKVGAILANLANMTILPQLPTGHGNLQTGSFTTGTKRFKELCGAYQCQLARNYIQ